MIPFALCRGQITWKKRIKTQYTDSDTLEIRILDLMPDGCTYRLPLAFKGHEADIKEMSFDFYLRARQLKVKLNSGFSVSEKNMNRYWTEWEMTADSAAFKEASLQLSKEYMEYIDAKLILDDSELSASIYRDYPKEEKIADNLSEQEEGFIRKVRESINPDSWKWVDEGMRRSIEIALECIPAYDDYLNTSFQEFMSGYWDKTGLKDHPLTKLPVKRLSVGNAFCSLQCPGQDRLKRIMEKAFSEGLSVNLVLAPVSESQVGDVCRYLNELNEILDKGRGKYPEIIGVESGDYGIYTWLQEKAFSHFQILSGFLMNKRLCDPRSNFKGVENSGRDGDNTLYLPFRQMNTGTFCTLYAAAVNGNRGRQERVENCRRFCERNVFLYPEHLNMTGRFNSLFYADIEALAEGKRVREVLDSNGRVILDFDTWRAGEGN